MDHQKPKIVFVLPALTAGGAERVLITLMNGLDRDRFEPVFITVCNKGPLKDLIDPGIAFHALGYASYGPQSLSKLYKMLKQLQPDIVVSTMAHMNFGVLLLRRLFPQTRFIVREAVMPSFILNGRGFVQKTIIRHLYKSLYPKADLVISPTGAIIEEFHSLLGLNTNNHEVLPNPVNMPYIRAQENKHIPMIAKRQNVVHFVASGRLHKQKGFDRLIAKLKDLPQDMAWRLSILGGGPEQENLETLIKDNGLEGHAHLAGHVDHPWPHYASADAFLLPSRSEGLPNVVLEALACGTKVIATRESGGIADIADAAPDGSVNIADNMDDFIAAMAQIRPNPSEKFRPSLLPSIYLPEKVLMRFTAMIDSVAEES